MDSKRTQAREHVNRTIKSVRAAAIHTNNEMEASSDYMSWSNLGSLTEGVPGVFRFEDTDTAGADKRFYRVLLP